MSTTYQFEDGKIIFVYRDDGSLKLINVVHSDESIANIVADKLICWLRNI